MGKDIVRRAKIAELARWTRQPTLLHPDLVRQKSGLTAREKHWVYWPVYALPPLVLTMLVSIAWMAAPLTMFSTAITLFFCSLILTLATVSSLVVIATSPNDDPLKNRKRRKFKEVPFSFEGRKKLCLLERNRLKALQQPERARRYAEADRKYPMFSVWSEPYGSSVNGDTGITLSIVEHIPPTWPMRRWGARLSAGNGKIAQYTFDEGDMRFALNKAAKIEKAKRDAEKVEISNMLFMPEDPENVTFLEFMSFQFGIYEHYARELEDRYYAQVVSRLENERTALLIRRL